MKLAVFFRFDAKLRGVTCVQASIGLGTGEFRSLGAPRGSRPFGKAARTIAHPPASRRELMAAMLTRSEQTDRIPIRGAGNRADRDAVN